MVTLTPSCLTRGLTAEAFPISAYLKWNRKKIKTDTCGWQLDKAGVALRKTLHHVKPDKRVKQGKTFSKLMGQGMVL